MDRQAAIDTWGRLLEAGLRPVLHAGDGAADTHRVHVPFPGGVLTADVVRTLLEAAGGAGAVLTIDQTGATIARPVDDSAEGTNPAAQQQGA